ncbi:hypothetical protein FQN54_003541 [Arachnomyces sp. PD_36]|nr:hypothetical protein FQN54_003541 [Arachnomyces sp. PD_36]
MGDDEVPLPPPPPSQKPSGLPFPTKHRSSISGLDFVRGGLPSSDPPVFSSDDLPSASVENYRQGGAGAGPAKRKRMYRGTWWGEVVNPKRKRVELKRKDLDSGVYMNSDDDVAVDNRAASDASGIGVMNREPPTRPQHPLSRDFVTAVPRAVVESVPKSHQQAQRHVNQCVEEGKETVDLDYYNLGNLPPGLLRPLAQMIRQPKWNEVPSELAFNSLTPHICLSLVRNELSTLPLELFDISNLKALSLRLNVLEEIPPAIKKLNRLEELSFAMNRLKYLPWELLELLKYGTLRRLTVHPNPFLTLKDSSDARVWYCRNPDPSLPIEEAAIMPRGRGEDAIGDRLPVILVAKSHLQFFDEEGRPTKSSDTLPPSSGAPKPSTSDLTAVPSLRELSLRALTCSPEFSRFIESELVDFPEPVIRVLGKAKEAMESGGRTCSVCSKVYVIPRAEWIEWWDCTPHEIGLGRALSGPLRPLPFMRRVCSSMCVPDRDKLLE